MTWCLTATRGHLTDVGRRDYRRQGDGHTLSGHRRGCREECSGFGPENHRGVHAGSELGCNRSARPVLDLRARDGVRTGSRHGPAPAPPEPRHDPRDGGARRRHERTCGRDRRPIRCAAADGKRGSAAGGCDTDRRPTTGRLDTGGCSGRSRAHDRLRWSGNLRLAGRFAAADDRARVVQRWGTRRAERDRDRLDRRRRRTGSGDNSRATRDGQRHGHGPGPDGLGRCGLRANHARERLGHGDRRRCCSDAGHHTGEYLGCHSYGKRGSRGVRARDGLSADRAGCKRHRSGWR